MSRRNYKKLEQQPLPPFYENLVFWAPLTEGDLTDHISGVSPTTDTGCSITWDNDKKMYFFVNNQVDFLNTSARYTGLNMGMNDGSAVSLVIDVEEHYRQNNSINVIFCTPDEVVEIQGYNPARITNSYWHPNAEKILHRYVLTCAKKVGSSKFSMKWYEDGILKYTSNWTAPLKLSDNIVTINQRTGNTGKFEIYAKNARIYNREFTAQEVAKL